MHILLAKFILKKYRPTVIAITGSLGKTTVKYALRTVLAASMSVYTSNASENDADGACKAILGGGGFARGVSLLLHRDAAYPRALLLEYGADHVGDIENCMAVAQPDISILTSLAPVHIDTLKTIERVTREKSLVVQNGSRNGWSILCYDDERVRALRSRARGRVMTYGLSDAADVRAIEISVDQEVREGEVVVKGTSFKLVYKGSAVPVHLPGVLGGQHISAALAAAAAGIILEMNLVSISQALATYTPTAGRMRLLSGIKHTLLVDDTYTASPTSVLAGLAGLDALAVKPGAEKFAVLGDMVSLGEYTIEGHREVGERVAEKGFDYLITVGKLSRDIGRAAREKGMPEAQVYHFTTPEEAGRFIQDRLEQGDCVYVSGNADLRMEKIVKEIMAEPMKADGLLLQR
ncbi:MAG: UDP-N-acetylmuramoyl-tripeptide--D-alanyl-D-alanine ligase [bacterium]|nr:UDP-N-acetylmuramoyl-tripeptide--D-alanyl-D-alanine ligase [bacterium]